MFPKTFFPSTFYPSTFFPPPPVGTVATPVLSFLPAALVFSAVAGSGITASQSVVISYVGGGTASPTLGTISAPWLTTPTVSGSTVSAAANPGALAASLTPYVGSFTVYDVNLSVLPITIPVYLVVTAPSIVVPTVTFTRGKYDSIDLLARFLRAGRIPAVRQFPADADVYGYLTEAQDQVITEISSHAPRALMGAPKAMITDDSGQTWSFGADTDGRPIFPMGHAEVYAAVGGQEMYASTYGDQDGDIVFEGDHVRIPGARSKAWSSGPWARFVAPSTYLDTGTNPIIKPANAGLLILYRALVLWANSGGLKDPSPYEANYQRAWAGNSTTGEVGFLGMYKLQYRRQLTAGQGGINWWRAWIASGGASLGTQYVDGSYVGDGTWTGDGSLTG